MFSRLKRYPRLLFFGFGFIVTVASVALVLGSDLATASLGYPVRISWPYWMGAIRWVIGYLPWIALAGALAARLYYGNGIRLFSFAAGLATPYLALMVHLFVGPVVEDHWHRQDFDASAWRAAAEDSRSNWPVRLTMADDLVGSGALKGKTRNEIEALLGPPTEIAKFPTWDLIYYLGPERGWLSIDSEWLVLKLGPDGRATEIALVHD